MNNKNLIVVEMADWKLRGDISIVLEDTGEASGRCSLAVVSTLTL